MSLRKQVLEEVRHVAETASQSIVSAIEREAARRRAEACVQHLFHQRMSLRLPRWRRIARAWHRALARRSEARCEAQRAQGNKIACALCAAAEKGGVV
jgi:hypothetical protein